MYSKYIIEYRHATLPLPSEKMVLYNYKLLALTGKHQKPVIVQTLL